jgi:hypothetical protein
MRSRFAAALAAAFLAIAAVAIAGPLFNNTKPTEVDPAKTGVIRATWVKGIGCPHKVVFPGETYENSLCTVADKKDKFFEGLLLAKTGPSTNPGFAQVELMQTKGAVLTTIGYDLRKPEGGLLDPRGSHCQDAPRWVITLQDGSKTELACRDADTFDEHNDGWTRLRWTGAKLPPGPIADLRIIMDAGQSGPAGTQTSFPDRFGISILDNLVVNDQIIGRGPT